MPTYDEDGKLIAVSHVEIYEVLVEIRDLLLKKTWPTTVNITNKGPVSHEDQQRIVREIQRVTEQTRHIPNAY